MLNDASAVAATAHAVTAGPTGQQGKRQQFSGDRGRTPKVAGAVRILIHSTPAPRISRGVIGLRPTPMPDGQLWK
ncbi:hypothetical protein DV515_00012871, partial [Chloebia gouldiae]